MFVEEGLCIKEGDDGVEEVDNGVAYPARDTSLWSLLFANRNTWRSVSKRGEISSTPIEIEKRGVELIVE